MHIHFNSVFQAEGVQNTFYRSKKCLIFQLDTQKYHILINKDSNFYKKYKNNTLIVLILSNKYKIIIYITNNYGHCVTQWHICCSNYCKEPFL